MYTDDNGIVRFEESDNVSPLHTALNTALQSVSTEIEQHQHDHIESDVGELTLRDGAARFIADTTNTLFRLESPTGGYSVLSAWSSDEQLGQLYFATTGTLSLDAGGNANAPNRVYVRPGGTLPLAFKGEGSSAVVPVPRVAAGNVPIVVPSGQTQRSVTVTFPAGRFTVRPIVALATHSLASTLINYSVTAVTTTSCSINVHRTSTAETLVDWIAVQI